MKLSKLLIDRLIKATVHVSENAFHPITPIGVGAAVLTTEDEIFTGCNVQTTISGLGVCAEQCAIYHAVANGKYDFKAVAVYFPSERFIKPCGVCLQLIAEFSQVIDKDVTIVMINKNKRIRLTSVNKELKDAYGVRISGKDISRYMKNKKSRTIS